MTARRIAPTTALTAALALGALAVPVAAQPPDDAAAPERTSSGQVLTVTDESGKTSYVLQLADGTQLALSFGPSWFWGPLNPLEALVGTTVEVTGNVAADGPDEHASATAQERAADKPKFKVKAVDGTPLREQGKPPWAGGPKVVGAAHPGYEGWSKGQANKAAHKAAKPEKAHGPDPEKAHGPDQD